MSTGAQGSRRSVAARAADVLAPSTRDRGQDDQAAAAAGDADRAPAAAASAGNPARAHVAEALHPLRPVRRGVPRRGDLPARRRLGRRRRHAGDRRAQAALCPVHRAEVHARLSVGRDLTGLLEPRRPHGQGAARRRHVPDASRTGVHRLRRALPEPRRARPRRAARRARVAEEHCVGCGLCEHFCPTEPTSIRVLPRA